MSARRVAPLGLLVVLTVTAVVFFVWRRESEVRFVDLGPRIAALAARDPDPDHSGETLVSLDFTRAADRGRVRAGEGASVIESGDSGARVRVAAKENRIAIDLPEWSGGGRDASAATFLLLELGTTKAHDVTWLYWTAPGEDASQRRSMPIGLPYDGALYTVVVPLEDSPEWKGTIESLHVRLGTEPIDLAADPPVVTLRSLTLLRTTLAERFAIESAGLETRSKSSLRSIRIGAETRPAVLAPAPSRLECEIGKVPAGSPRLGGAIALHAAAFGRHAAPVEFRVTADGETLFSRSVDPMNPADRGWIEYRADLKRLAGRSARIAFETRSAGGAGAYALFSRPVVWSDTANGGPIRGVVLVSLDTLRADRLSCYGPAGSPATTPHLDALAAESVRFSRAISAAPETIASHMSLFTACVPSVHGIVDMGIAIADDVVTLADRFSEAGFATAAFTEGGNIGASFGFAQGFDTFVETERGARGEKRIEETIAAAEKWLSAHGDRPFFLFVHSYEAHTPYDPPEELRKRFDPGYAGAYETNVSWGDVVQMLLGEKPANERDYEHVRLLYDAGVRHVDAEIGGFIDRLRSSGTLEATLLAVTSDHGEDFFDHFGFATHGHSLYDELLHVPLLVRVPGVAARVVEEPVALLSLGPTILDVMGLGAFPREVTRRVQGKSFARALRGERFEAPEFVFSEDESFLRRFSLRLPRMKFIHNPTIERMPKKGEDPAGGAVLAGDIRRILASPRFAWTGVQEKVDGWLREVELYDLENDPREQRNLAPERGGEVAAYLGRLEAYRKSLPGPLPQRHSALSSSDLQRLITLGYIKGK